MPEQTKTSSPDDAGDPDANPYRLPRTVVPVRYDLTLEPDLDAATFSGQVVASVTVTEATGAVVLNAAELEIDEAWVEPAGGDRVDVSVDLDAETERATLTPVHELPPGEATVHLRFRGVLNDKLRGFYRSTFTADDGSTHTLATTQMEATDARRAFPCWDEPDLKAVFGVTLVVDEGLLAVSNAAVLERTPAGRGRVAVRFADTIAMSTYLVAFVIGPLEATEPIDVEGTPLRVIHPPGRGHLTGYARDAGAFALRWFTEWFGIPYVGDKLDLVAIPDFAFGAMENLGCVTFRERLLLVDPEAATQQERQRVVDVIAHELAHMWFGDLVTMRWWNGIWLNEAFATFMEMLATDAYRPDWERWVFFGRERTPAFDTDSLTGTRPIEFPVTSPHDAEGMFDVLTYQKGSAVVRMLQQYLGEDRFQAGIRRYMERHSYGSTETSDLWDALEAETGEPVRRIAESWIFQGGFPQVSVSSGGDGTVELRQRRFRYSDGLPGAAGGDGDDAGARWAVPAVVRARVAGAGEPVEQRVLLDGDTARVQLGGEPEWVNANAGANGFYRVRYGGDLQTRLVAARSQLGPLERYAVVDDAWAAVLAGTTEAASFLALAEEMADETDLYVWELLLTGLTSLERLVEGEPRDRYAARVRELLGPIAARVGPEPRAEDDDRTRSLRADLLRASAVVGRDPEALERSRELLDRYLADRGSVDASLGTAALHAAVTFGDVTLHKEIDQAFRAASTPQERDRLMRALGSFRDPAALSRTLELSISSAMRSQDAPYVLLDALSNRDNTRTTWNFLAIKWDQINGTFPSNSISRMLGGIRGVRERGLATAIAEFLESHPVPQGEKQVRQHVERMWVTVALADREAERFPAALTA